MQEGIITKLEVQERNKKRVNVFLNEEYAFSLTLDEAAKLHKGQRLSASEIEALRGQDAVTRAVDSAAHFLSYRPRSVQEVRQNLSQKDLPQPVIEAALEKLIANGYLNDSTFARLWVEDRNRSKPCSHKALRYELRQKGVPEAIVNEVLADLDIDDAAYRAAQGQLRRLRGGTRQAFREKIAAFLQRRGFSYAIARDTIRRLTEELDLEEPDYFRGDQDEAGLDDEP